MVVVGKTNIFAFLTTTTTSSTELSIYPFHTWHCTYHHFSLFLSSQLPPFLCTIHIYTRNYTQEQYSNGHGINHCIGCCHGTNLGDATSKEKAQDNQAFNVVSMKEYLETEGLTGHLVNKVSEFEGIHTFIPRNGRVLFYYYLNCGTGHSNFSRILLCLFLDVP
jgi:hypothetical protein